MLRTIFAGLVLGVMFASQAMGAERQALVIGNSAYVDIPSLRSAAADAALVGGALRSAGFEVATLTNADGGQLAEAFALLGRQAGKDAILLVYYAGQGIQVEGENYMIPVDAKLTPDLDLPAVPIGAAFDGMAGADGSALIFIFDASRQANLPGSGDKVHPVYDGPRRSQEVANALLAFSTSPGAALFDHDGENGPYAVALSDALATPGLSTTELFRTVRQQVAEKTDGKLRAWEQSSLQDDLVLSNK